MQLKSLQEEARKLVKAQIPTLKIMNLMIDTLNLEERFGLLMDDNLKKNIIRIKEFLRKIH